jgi:hypothetical protein
MKPSKKNWNLRVCICRRWCTRFLHFVQPRFSGFSIFRSAGDLIRKPQAEYRKKRFFFPERHFLTIVNTEFLLRINNCSSYEILFSDSGMARDSYLWVVTFYGLANSWVSMFEINLMCRSVVIQWTQPNMLQHLDLNCQGLFFRNSNGLSYPLAP